VSADNKQVQKLAASIRATKAKLRHTYSLALAVIFLDRLGNSEDAALVKTFALRLVAGQTATGSWSYHCPILSAADEKKLSEYLELNASVVPTVKSTGKPRGVERLSTNLKSLGVVSWQRGITPTIRPVGPMPGPGGPGFGPPPGGPGFGPPPGPGGPGRPPGAPPGPPGVGPRPGGPGGNPAQPGGKPGNGGPGGNMPGPGGPPGGGPPPGMGDNSNAQFALLGLWVARRSGLPVQPSLAFVEQMFRKSQVKDGGWDYIGMMKTQPSTASMTCAGLLGMAVGRGLQVRMVGDGDKELPKLDPSIKNGFKALDQHVKPLIEGQPFTGEPGHRYYLYWSLERVGMLYDMNQLAGKDWYPWLSKLIVSEQAGDGSWQGPPPDTCFALLVLRRVNIVQDLTESLVKSKALLELQNQKIPAVPVEDPKAIKP
jgi:hypothetical protein